MERVELLSFLFNFWYALVFIVENCNYFVDAQSNRSSSSSSCYITSSQTNTTWELIWEDQFDNETSFHIGWSALHERKVCKQIFSEHLSCSDRDNFYLHKGYLALMAKYDSKRIKFTGAQLINRHQFVEGRYEIRAAQPIGHFLQACFYTNNDRESFGNLYGLILIYCYNPPDEPKIGFRYKYTSDYKQIEFDKQMKLNWKLTGFHLYGVEWNRKEIQFFVDETFSETLTLEHELNQKHKLYLHLIVREINGQKPKIANLEWPCPVFIIDYVKVYRNVTNYYDLTQNSHSKCLTSQSDPTIDEEVISNEICQISKRKASANVYEDSLGIVLNTAKSSSLRTILILTIIFLLLCLLGIVYFLIKIYKRRLRIESEQQKELQILNVHDLIDEENYEYTEIIYAE